MWDFSQFRTFCAASLRHMGRNWLYMTIHILGLAAGFASLILIALYVRNEVNFDRFLPGSEHAYLLVASTGPEGAQTHYATTPPAFATALRRDLPGVTIARTAEDQAIVTHQGHVSRYAETFVYADSDLFTVLSFPVLSGRLDQALEQPDSVVITRKIARAYFGRDAPIGETLQISPLSDPRGTHTVRVTAVLQDFPVETNLTANIFLSANAPFSAFRQTPGEACPTCIGEGENRTWVRLNRSVSAAHTQSDIAASVRRQIGPSLTVSLVPIRDLHQRPDIHKLDKPAIASSLIAALYGFGSLVLAITAINFVNLVMARASERAVEVAVRKISGAGRHELVMQFVCEGLLYVTIALVVGVALVEQLIGPVSRILRRDLYFDGARDWSLAVLILAAWAAVCLLATVWPALTMSAYRPANVLRQTQVFSRAAGHLRQGLFTVQYALLITLMICTGVIYQQTVYAFSKGVHLNTDRVLITWTCHPAVRAAIDRLPQVESTTCSNWTAVSNASTLSGTGAIPSSYVDYGFFELYGIQPLAGRLFQPGIKDDRGAWEASPPISANEASSYRLRNVILNRAAVDASGFASPADAIGKSVVLKEDNTVHPAQIIGVVPDFSVDSIRRKVTPAAYGLMPYPMELMSIRLRTGDTRAVRQTIRQILTAHAGHPQAVYLLRRYIEDQFEDMQSLTALLTICTCIALIVAGFGVLSLSIFAAAQRRREIAIRKAMGAAWPDILRLIGVRYSLPLLLANLLAWPVAYFLIRRWLDGFADQVTPDFRIFLAAGAIAVAIAWITLALHARVIARTRPAKALRYE